MNGRTHSSYNTFIFFLILVAAATMETSSSSEEGYTTSATRQVVRSGKVPQMLVMVQLWLLVEHFMGFSGGLQPALTSNRSKQLRMRAALLDDIKTLLQDIFGNEEFGLCICTDMVWQRWMDVFIIQAHMLRTCKSMF